jgi:hypothetical protein
MRRASSAGGAARLAAARVRATIPRVRGYFIAAGVLYVLDGWLLGQGVLTVLVAFVMVLLALARIVQGLAGGRGRLREGLVLLGLWLATVTAVLGTVTVDKRLARRTAERVIAALDRYRADHGAYPEELGALVPTYLSSVPFAKHTGVFVWFHYYCGPPSEPVRRCSLGYVELPPFGRNYYVLEEHRWGYLD